MSNELLRELTLFVAFLFIHVCSLEAQHWEAYWDGGAYDQVSGDILLAKDYISTAEFNEATEILDSIPNRYSQSANELMDLDDIESIISILQTRGVYNLTQADLETLELISKNFGHGASMARGILSLSGYNFGTRYELPSGSSQNRVAIVTSETHTIESEPTVYPNPLDSDQQLNVSVPSEMFTDGLSIKLWSINGTILMDLALNSPISNVSLPGLNGTLIYQIVEYDRVLKTGVIVIAK